VASGPGGPGTVARRDRGIMIEQLRTDAQKMTGDLIRWRRDFHRHPELANEEHRTSAVIRHYLENLSIPFRVCAGTGVAALLQGAPGSRTVALRADMDALPLEEEGSKPYRSENPGVCHACGHDGHMAILMGAAGLLAKRRAEFSGNVVFLFQPAEEKLPGGALAMIRDGALQEVDAIFGLHLWAGFPTGTIACRKGAMMASTDEITITIHGRGGHGSMPHDTVDPILAASQLVVNLQSIVSRNVDPLQSAVLSIGKIEGGTAPNIIPPSVKLYGTVRTFDGSLRDLIEKRIGEIVEGTCRAFGAVGELRYERGYPALINEDGAADLVLDTARRTLGAERILNAAPVMGGEDFACYLQQIPGAFLFFGMGNGVGYPHHHPAFDMDEEALPQAALLLSSLALEYLNRE
jgi:amidohydrolase